MSVLVTTAQVPVELCLYLLIHNKLIILNIDSVGWTPSATLGVVSLCRSEPVRHITAALTLQAGDLSSHCYECAKTLHQMVPGGHRYVEMMDGYWCGAAVDSRKQSAVDLVIP